MGANEAEKLMVQAFALVKQGRLTEAIVHVKRAVELDAEYGEAWLALGSLYADTGLFQQAERASRIAIALLPGVAEAKINLVNALISQEKQDEAIALCKSIKEDNPAHPGIWHSLGLAFKAQGLIQDADQCWFQHLLMQPDHQRRLYGILKDRMEGYRN